MDLTKSHYNASNGTLFTFDAQARRITPDKVQYANPSPYTIDAGLNARVGGLIPNIEFQTGFMNAFYKAFDEVQKESGLLQFRKGGAVEDGQDFLNGDLTFLVERSDFPGHADYRAEFRATLAVNEFDGTTTSLYEYVKEELATLAAKK